MASKDGKVWKEAPPGLRAKAMKAFEEKQRKEKDRVARFGQIRHSRNLSDGETGFAISQRQRFLPAASLPLLVLLDDQPQWVYSIFHIEVELGREMFVRQQLVYASHRYAAERYCSEGFEVVGGFECSGQCAAQSVLANVRDCAADPDVVEAGSRVASVSEFFVGVQDTVRHDHQFTDPSLRLRVSRHRDAWEQ
jgi:hypothetical protein